VVIFSKVLSIHLSADFEQNRKKTSIGIKVNLTEEQNRCFHNAGSQRYHTIICSVNFNKFGNMILRANFNVICILAIKSILSTKLKIEFCKISKNCLLWKRHGHKIYLFKINQIYLKRFLIRRTSIDIQ
jgi:hypothetical protein